MDSRHESIDLATPTILRQPLGQRLGLAEMLEHFPTFTELAQYRRATASEFRRPVPARPESPAVHRAAQACSNQARASANADRAAAFPPACRRYCTAFSRFSPCTA